MCPTTELPLLVVVLSKDTLEVVSGSRHQRFFSRLVHGQFYTGKHSVSMPKLQSSRGQGWYGFVFPKQMLQSLVVCKDCELAFKQKKLCH